MIECSRQVKRIIRRKVECKEQVFKDFLEKEISDGCNCGIIEKEKDGTLSIAFGAGKVKAKILFGKNNSFVIKQERKNPDQIIRYYCKFYSNSGKIVTERKETEEEKSNIEYRYILSNGCHITILLKEKERPQEQIVINLHCEMQEDIKGLIKKMNLEEILECYMESLHAKALKREMTIETLYEDVEKAFDRKELENYHIQKIGTKCTEEYLDVLWVAKGETNKENTEKEKIITYKKRTKEGEISFHSKVGWTFPEQSVNQIPKFLKPFLKRGY